jgi:hypothetical protein
VVEAQTILRRDAAAGLRLAAMAQREPARLIRPDPFCYRQSQSGKRRARLSMRYRPSAPFALGTVGSAMVGKMTERCTGPAKRRNPPTLIGTLLGKREQIPPDTADRVLAPFQLDTAGQPAVGVRGDPPGSAKCEVPDPRPDSGSE